MATFIKVKNCYTCPCSYVRLDDETGCSIKRGIRVGEDVKNETIHKECPLREKMITLTI